MVVAASPCSCWRDEAIHIAPCDFPYVRARMGEEEFEVNAVALHRCDE
jgi:hypothetical protein